MKIPSNRTRQAMETAAELRAAGATWETIAAQLQRHKVVVSRWPRYYAEEWEQLLRDAEQRALRHANNEARSMLRAALRSDDAKERLAAAKQLAQLRKDEMAAEPDTDQPSRYTHFTSQIQELSDEELQRVLRKFVRDLQQTGGNQLGSAGTAGEAGTELPD